MFENSKQHEVIDGLMDGTPSNIEELSEKVFCDLIECNNNEVMKFSSYVLSKVWNKSDAVQFGLTGGKTANDFHSNEKWNKEN